MVAPDLNGRINGLLIPDTSRTADPPVLLRSSSPRPRVTVSPRPRCAASRRHAPRAGLHYVNRYTIIGVSGKEPLHG
jgi:hypothetical protein